MYVIQHYDKYSELQETFDFPYLENVNQNTVSLQPYPGNIRFSVYIIEVGSSFHLHAIRLISITFRTLSNKKARILTIQAMSG